MPPQKNKNRITLFSGLPKISQKILIFPCHQFDQSRLFHFEGTTPSCMSAHRSTFHRHWKTSETVRFTSIRQQHYVGTVNSALCIQKWLFARHDHKLFHCACQIKVGGPLLKCFTFPPQQGEQRARDSLKEMEHLYISKAQSYTKISHISPLEFHCTSIFPYISKVTEKECLKHFHNFDLKGFKPLYLLLKLPK